MRVKIWTSSVDKEIERPISEEDKVTKVALAYVIEEQGCKLIRFSMGF